MKKLAILLLTIPVLSLFACTDKNDNPAPPQPVESESAIAGSFVGKFSRFSKGERFNGKIITEWNDTVWRNERINQQVMIWTDDETVDDLDFFVSDFINGDN